MRIKINNELCIYEPSAAVLDYCRNHLVLDNPDYYKKERLGKWTGNTPKDIQLYVRDGDLLYIPYGCKNKILAISDGCPKEWGLYPNIKDYMVDYHSAISLYDYQAEAVEMMRRAINGVCVMPCGSGKGLPLDAKIYTPDGFKLNGSLRVGDDVIGSDGKTYQVTGIYDKGEVPAYKITFSDNTEIVCDKDHLWTVQKQTQRFCNPNKWWTVSTEEIYKQYKNIKRQDLLYIPVVKPVEFKAKEVHLNPWLLGFLIGDGCFREDISVSIAESDLLQKVADIVHNEYPTEIMKVKNKWDWRFVGGNIKHAIDNVGLSKKHSYEKFIPDEYKYNSISIRLSVLQGLFDADGYCGNGGVYEYSTSSKQLAEDVVEIIQSLSGTAKIRVKKPVYTYKGEKMIGKNSYRIHFKLYDFMPFTSIKHNMRYHERTYYTKPYRIIKNIVPCNPIISRCITVNAPDSLYITDGFVVTHNTQTALELVARLGLRALWLTHTQDLLRQSLERAKSCFGCDPDMYGTITEGKVNIGKGITFATVQTMCKIDLQKYRKEWAVIVVDECLSGNTLIHTSNGEKPIKRLCEGDTVASYNIASKEIEYKPVTHLFKFKAHNIVKITLNGGEKIIATANHPFYTVSGNWINAGDLRGGDYVLRILQERDKLGESVENKSLSKPEKRLGILLQRVCKERRKGTRGMDGGTPKNVLGNDETYQCEVSRPIFSENESKQSDETEGSKREIFCSAEGNQSSSKNTRRKWYRADYSSRKIHEGINEQANRSLHRTSDTNEEAKRERISDLLQSGYSDTQVYDCDRDRWQFSYGNKPTSTGCQEGCAFEWIRVESVEVQESTSDGTYDGLCDDGYVYNIEVKDNNNYFANGILVHNCQHCCGSPTRVSQFYKVVNSLYAPYKFGLTATPYRNDGLDASMYALLGDIVIEVSNDVVAERTCAVKVQAIDTGYMPNYDAVLNGDGTINYSDLIKDLISDNKRFRVIMDVVNRECKRYSIVLANRIKYLKDMQQAYSGKSICISSNSTSKKAKAERKEALRRLNSGEIDCIFATYQLAAEGLDCPNLRYVVFATPEKDKRTVIQSVGRVARKADGKEYGTVIDFVDAFSLYQGWYKKRVGFYKSLKCEVNEDGRTNKGYRNYI